MTPMLFLMAKEVEWRDHDSVRLNDLLRSALTMEASVMTSAATDLAVAGLLKPRDIASLPPRRGRHASPLYPSLINAFLAAGEQAMDVDSERIGRRPETVRTALVRATKKLGVEDKVRVSKVGDEVVLIYRIHSPAHGFPISPYEDEMADEVAAG